MKSMIDTAMDLTDGLAGYLASRGGVANTFPQSGSPLPGENAPSLMAAHLKQDGMDMPVAKQDQDFKSLVKAPEFKMG